ncbi:molybdopterin synthase sulfur carrier subunit [Singulisphaera sp. GP187]|uniref:molybdopterin converting factor subunit 1 n=1 Tax=Singulisphaera sp. GP187 TaxID=1882752 RepID=UPI00092B8C71|nr:molybdopterin converting factor subunit 1 [Singulisphaera sp. GP187]SIO58652.1 molybdopterin synthase sulfur carrier subunit [Singulisphaera sp. GP187]
MQLTIRLFALAKQKAGRPEITLELPESATVAHLRQEIARTCPELAPLVSSLMVAINSEYADDQRSIKAGEEIALIPPVSGGTPLDQRNPQTLTSLPSRF